MAAPGAGRCERALLDAAAVTAAWGVLLLAENVAVPLLWAQAFSGAWEVSLARHDVVPVAFAVLSPMSLAAVAAWTLAERAARGVRGAARALGGAGAVGAAAVAIGVSGGRHLAPWAVRVPFVLALTAGGWAAGAVLLVRVGRLRDRPTALAAFGLLTTAGAWLADVYVLPRLYPAFHAALLVTSLLGMALVGLAFRAGAKRGPASRACGVLTTAIVAACAAWTPRALRALERASNVRIALVEHAPLLGATVVAASRLDTVDSSAPARAGDGAAGRAPTAPGEVARALDWTGRDIVLLSIDALRADHVTAYGYGRPTTPQIDALAREGTLFESAYCPTPHTSYSVTSMLTGKYVRPLLALGLGSDSETWPQMLRRYGWRTAAFYPPAVFFIDEDRFVGFERDHLGFEYAKVEFADPALRERQVAEYLDRAGDAPLFLWVHFFEPHEPYVVHPEHVFSGGAAPDIDAYDSEVAAADEGVGRVARVVRERRPGAVLVVTADHGEEFGDHGGRYHGSTVYEEQVRVPLVVVGAGVRKGARVSTVVQTIDLLPTALSALGIPRPARVRGRDLGSLLAGAGPSTADDGFAFVETDDDTLVASGDDRLICERRAAACAMYRPRQDPLERRDFAPDAPARFEALRAALRAVERDHGLYEASTGPAWPPALRRGMQGEADAVLDVAALLDDADVVIRRKAAEVCFQLQAPDVIPALRRALERDEDDEVRRWSALALARAGEPLAPVVEAMTRDGRAEWRRRAALALAQRGDARACEEIARWWSEVVPPPGQGSADGEPPRVALDLPQARELLAATGKARCRAAVPVLVRALDDVRARPYVADALGAIGDERARPALLAVLAAEPYVTARPHEARALLALGARGALDWSAPTAAPEVDATLAAPKHARSARLLVLLSDARASLEGRAAGVPFRSEADGDEVRSLDLPASGAASVHVELRVSSGGVLGAWLVPGGRLD